MMHTCRAHEVCALARPFCSNGRSFLASFSGMAESHAGIWSGPIFFCGLAIKPEMAERDHFTQQLHHVTGLVLKQRCRYGYIQVFRQRQEPDALKAFRIPFHQDVIGDRVPALIGHQFDRQIRVPGTENNTLAP